MKGLILVLITVLFNASANLLLRYGAMRGSNQYPDFTSIKSMMSFFRSFLQLPIIGGAILFAIGLIFWILALSKIEVSTAAPLMGLSYVLIAVLGHLLLGETLTLYKIVGMGLIWLGVFFLVGKPSL